MGRTNLHEVAILIPCYNEAPTIARVVASFPVMASGFEIKTELTIHAIEMHMLAGEVMVPFRERLQYSSIPAPWSETLPAP